MSRCRLRLAVSGSALGFAKFNVKPCIFKQTLLEQLQTDGIAIDMQKIQSLFGDTVLCTTNNDRRTIGVQNSLSVNFEDWKYEFGDFSNWPFRDLNRRINGIPYKQIGWKKPKEKMKEVLEEISS